MNNWILLVHHNPALDPRIGWITDYAPENINIKVIAFHQDDKENRVINNGKEKKLKKKFSCRKNNGALIPFSVHL